MLSNFVANNVDLKGKLGGVSGPASLALLLGVFLFIIGCMFLDAYIFQHAWNYVIPYITKGWALTLDTWQAFWGLIVVNALGCRFGRSSTNTTVKEA